MPMSVQALLTWSMVLQCARAAWRRVLPRLCSCCLWLLYWFHARCAYNLSLTSALPTAQQPFLVAAESVLWPFAGTLAVEQRLFKVFCGFHITHGLHRMALWAVSMSSLQLDLPMFLLSAVAATGPAPEESSRSISTQPNRALQTFLHIHITSLASRAGLLMPAEADDFCK